MEHYTRIETSLTSRHLQRPVHFTLLLPPGYSQSEATYPLLLLNDGQDLTNLQFEKTLNRLVRQHQIPPLIVAAMHANQERKQEYGVAGYPDYAGRGAKAASHTRFVLEEFLPFLRHTYRVQTEPGQNFFAGFSLGGLSALDIVWRHPEVFSRAGVFSGALWWRSRDLNNGYNEATDRIIHARIRETDYKPGLKFWFQTGTEDEVSDRNNNGIIDSIDDTLDLIAELERKGYRKGADIAYVEVEGGRHDQHTWGEVMPAFLEWLFQE